MTIIVFITFSELACLNQIFGYFIMYTKFQLDNQSHQIQCMYIVIINCTLHDIVCCHSIISFQMRPLVPTLAIMCPESKLMELNTINYSGRYVIMHINNKKSNGSAYIVSAVHCSLVTLMPVVIGSWSELAGLVVLPIHMCLLIPANVPLLKA